VKYVSWFSGIGGFDLAMNRAGHERVGACEIDDHVRKVYEARLGRPAWFPNDITKVKAEDIPEADIWVGGFPCQDVSVAGKRAGLAGERTGLWWTWHALMRDRHPAWLLIENVPGLLSSNDGKDWEDILDSLCNLGYMVDSEILDARHFGVAQRRRRVFLVCVRADAGLTRRTHFSEMLLVTLATQSLRDALVEASGRSVTVDTGLTFDFSDAVRGLRRTMRSCENSLGKLIWSNLLRDFDDLSPQYASELNRLASPPSECLVDGMSKTDTANTAPKKMGGVSPVSSISRSWKKCWGGASKNLNSSTTSMGTSSTINERISTFSQALLHICERIAVSNPCCEFCSNAAWSASTALSVSMSLLEEVGNDLFTEDTRRSSAWDLLGKLRRTHGQLVQHLGERDDPVALLSVLEGGSGNSPPSAATRARTTPWSAIGAGDVGVEVAGTLGGGSGKRGYPDDLDRSGAFIPMDGQHATTRGGDPVSNALNAHGSRRYDGESETFVAEVVAPALRTNPYNNSDPGMESKMLVGAPVAAPRSDGVLDGQIGLFEDIESIQCHGGNVGPMGALRRGNGNETGGVPVALVEQEVASAILARDAGSGGARRDGMDNVVAPMEVANPLTASAGHHGHSSPRGDGQDNLVVGALTAGYGRGSGVHPNRMQRGDGIVVEPTYCIEDPGRKESGGPEVGLGVSEEVAYTLQAGSKHAVASPPTEPMAVMENGRNELRLTPYTTALTGGGGKPGQGYQAVLLPSEPMALGENQAGGPSVRLTTQTGALSGAGGKPGQGYQAVLLPPEGVTAFSSKDDGRDATSDLSPTLRSGVHKDSHANGGTPPAVSGEADRAGVVRRLTPTECERLQGFPDGWSCTCGCQPYSTANCKCPDSNRYKALGNAVAVPVVQWIAVRLARAEGKIRT
jgi:DNA-cytosine methyltransferase